VRIGHSPTVYRQLFQSIALKEHVIYRDICTYITEKSTGAPLVYEKPGSAQDATDAMRSKH
jgi:hypothetical protein